jgi:hypothetical protein
MICDECETVAHCLKNGCVPKHQALDRMAENARELGLDYEPAPVQDNDAHYKGVVEGVQKLFDDKRAQPAPEQYTALEQALTRLQKRYGELEAKVAAKRQWVGLDDADLAVCGDEDDVLLARYWERVCKEKNT